MTDMHLQRLPIRPYLNFKAFCDHYRGFSFTVWRTEKKAEFPCFACHGTGRIHDPGDPPDVIEGYKLVRKIACGRCEGSGDMGAQAYKKRYKHEITLWQNRHGEAKARLAIQKTALAKLSEEEREALGWACK